MVTEHIDHYIIETVVGTGGMAKVYKAFDQKIKRYVAVKMLGEHYTNQDYLYERFEQEATLIAKLEHHAIVPVYDYGKFEDRPYIVMRLMTGGSLAERLEQGPLDLEPAAEILGRICSALDKAHANSVIHRDIKPGNILFDDEGVAYLADFGIARFSEMTQSGMVVGSPHYMSPEQARGNPIDHRSDVYQLGVLLFEMLTGTLPFDGESIDSVIYQHVHEPVPLLKSINPELPKKYQQVVEDALQKDRDKRIPTAMDLSVRFQELINEDSASRALAGRKTLFDFESDTLFDHPSNTIRGGSTRLLLLLTIVVALLVSLYTVPAFREDERIASGLNAAATLVAQMPAEAQRIQQEGVNQFNRMSGNFTPSPVPTVAPSTTPTTVVVVAAVTEEPVAPAPTATNTPPLPPPTQSPDTATFTPTPTLTETPTHTPEPTFTPTPTLPPEGALVTREEFAELSGGTGIVVFSSYNDETRSYDLIRTLDNGEDLQLTNANINYYGADWSPDGSQIAYFGASSPQEIFVMNADGTNIRQLTDNKFPDEYPDWSPDGSMIVFHSGRGDTFDEYDIYLIETDGRVNSERRLTDNGESYSPSFSPDNRYIAYESFSNGVRQIFIYDLQTEDVVQVTSGNGNFFHPVWSNDPVNPQLAFFSPRDGKNDIFVINPDGTELSKLTNNFEFDAFHPTWTPNDEYIVFHALMDEEVNYNRDLWMIKPNGSGLLRVTDTTRREQEVSLMPPPPPN